MRTKNFKYTNIVLITLISLRLILLVFNIHFFSSSIEVYFWMYTLIFLILNWITSATGLYREISGILVVVGLAIFIGSQIYFVFYSKSCKPQTYSNFEYKVWQDFEQAAFGGTPHCYIAFGETYLGDLLYKQKGKFEFDCDNGNIDSVNFILPKNFDRLKLIGCVFYEKEALLFDQYNNTCYRLEHKK